jgi:transcriptional regulator with XRE-family HTH domain
MGLTAKEKKEWTKLMFLKDNKTQREISDITGVSEKTISKWKKEENWDRLRSSIIISKAEELRRIYQQINELNTKIEKRPDGDRYANSKEADTLSKLAATAKNLESDLSVVDIIDAFIGFQDWLREVNLELAKAIIELQDRYIKHKLNG